MLIITTLKGSGLWPFEGSDWAILACDAAIADQGRVGEGLGQGEAFEKQAAAEAGKALASPADRVFFLSLRRARFQRKY